MSFQERRSPSCVFHCNVLALFYRLHAFSRQQLSRTCTDVTSQILDDLSGEIRRARGPTHIGCANMTFVDHIKSGSSDGISDGVESKVPKHHGGAENHSSWVGTVGPHNILRDVPAAGLEEGVFPADIATRDDTGPANEGSANVGNDSAIKVGHDHDIELGRPRHELHGGVVDDHVIEGEPRVLVLLCNLAESVKEQAVAELHDVGLVHTSDFLAVVFEGKVKGETNNAVCLCTSGDLETFYDARVALVLEARVLALGVLTNDGKIHTLVTGGEARERLAKDDGGVDVKLLTHGNVPGDVTGLGYRGEENAFEADSVALKGLHSFSEEALAL